MHSNSNTDTSTLENNTSTLPFIFDLTCTLSKPVTINDNLDAFSPTQTFTTDSQQPTTATNTSPASDNTSASTLNSPGPEPSSYIHNTNNNNQHPQSNTPIPDLHSEVTHPTHLHTRTSTRLRYAPAHLKDFDCNIVYSSSLYDISNYI